MMTGVITRLIRGETLSPGEIEDALHRIMEGEVEATQVAALLVGLACRPPGPEILAAAAGVLRFHGLSVRPSVRPLVDTCGTGGDGAGTFNVSTTAAMVVAGAGAAVAKHGGRGVSSPVGSADVMDAAGVRLDLSPQRAEELLDATGFVFLHAPVFHPAMARVASVRRSLGVRTIFNLLGPLANPARAECQLLGVSEPSLTAVMAETLRRLGSRSALVVHCGGLDEVGLHAPTFGHRLIEGEVRPFRLDPRELGLSAAPPAALAGGDAATNARIMRGVLAGEEGPRADVVALNAGAALMVAGMAQDVREGFHVAREVLAGGDALRVLERYVSSSAKLEAA